MAILSVQNLKKSFDDTKVLNDITFELEKGQVLAIIGSSGSGKTTLLRCLNFLETADGGSFSVNGDVLFDAKKQTKRENGIREKRLHFGLVFQSFNLFPHYTVLKNIELAPMLRQKELIKEQRLKFKDELKNEYKGFKLFREVKRQTLDFKKKLAKQNEDTALELLNTVGLSEKAKAYPCELSGGQQQRVAIARALALKPDILCFDEPTSALDPELTGEVLKVIRALKSKDRTMIVVTHEMEFAKNVADKVIFMADGIIVEEGTPKQVFLNPKDERTKVFLQKKDEI